LFSGHCGLIGKASAQESATVGAFDLRFSDPGGDEGMKQKFRDVRIQKNGESGIQNQVNIS
jgi:hypothetical protein